MYRLPKRMHAVVSANTNRRKVSLDLSGDVYHLSAGEALDLSDKLVAASEAITLAAP